MSARSAANSVVDAHSEIEPATLGPSAISAPLREIRLSGLTQRRRDRREEGGRQFSPDICPAKRGGALTMI